MTDTKRQAALKAYADSLRKHPGGQGGMKSHRRAWDAALAAGVTEQELRAIQGAWLKELYPQFGEPFGGCDEQTIALAV